MLVVGVFLQTEMLELMLDLLLSADEYPRSWRHLLQTSGQFVKNPIIEMRNDLTPFVELERGEEGGSRRRGRSEKEEGKSVWVGRGGGAWEEV